MDEELPKLPYTVKEYADRARVTQNCVYVMVRRGESTCGAVRPRDPHPVRLATGS